MAQKLLQTFYKSISLQEAERKEQNGGKRKTPEGARKLFCCGKRFNFLLIRFSASLRLRKKEKKKKNLNLNRRRLAANVAKLNEL